MPLRMAGQYEDSETGLFYNYFRFYDPKTGRYVENDPIDLAGGLNRYGYVGGSPLLGIDPYGQSTVGTTAAAGAVAGFGIGVAACSSTGVGVIAAGACGAAGAAAGGAFGAAVGGLWDKAVGAWMEASDNAKAEPDVKEKPAICDVEPDDLCEQLALAEAKAGAGIQIMGQMGDEPRLIAHYGAGPWVKKEHKHTCNDGRQKVIHYFHSLTTGKNVELKFKKR